MNRQFSFRYGRGTIYAINEVLYIVRFVAARTSREQCLCLLVTLDVRNTFNMASWRAIDAALRRRWISEYLVRILRSYMENRSILVSDDMGHESMYVVPQDSILGPVCGMSSMTGFWAWTFHRSTCYWIRR